LLDGLFEHPASIVAFVSYGRLHGCFMYKTSFSAAC
jgi:hypothetical protein